MPEKQEMGYLEALTKRILAGRIEHPGVYAALLTSGFDPNTISDVATLMSLPHLYPRSPKL